MINPDGTNGNIIVAFIGIAISMVVGFVLTMIFYHDEKTGKTGEIDMKKNREKEDKIGKIEKFDKNESDKIDRKERKTEKISSPLKGEVIALSDVQDEAFHRERLDLERQLTRKKEFCMHRQTEQSLCFSDRSCNRDDNGRRSGIADPCRNGYGTVGRKGIPSIRQRRRSRNERTEAFRI